MGWDVQDLQLVQMLVAASSGIEFDPNFLETKFVAMKAMPFVSENACARFKRKVSKDEVDFVRSDLQRKGDGRNDERNHEG